MIKTLQPLLFFLLSALSVSLSAQALNSGYGYKDLYIGMAIDEIKTKLGEPEQIRTASEEADAYKGSGYKPEKELPFIIGFDHMYEFSNNSYNIWKVYIRNSKMVYAILSSYQSDEEVVKNMTIDGKLKYKESIAEMKKVMGTAYVQSKDSPDDYHYLSKGMSFYFYDGELSVVYLYAPISSGSLKKTAKRLGAR